MIRNWASLDPASSSWSLCHYKSTSTTSHALVQAGSNQDASRSRKGKREYRQYRGHGSHLPDLAASLRIRLISHGNSISSTLMSKTLTPAATHLASLLLSASSFCIASAVNGIITGPNSSLSQKSLQTPLNLFGAPFLSSYCTAPGPYNPASYASFLCLRSSSWIAWEMRGMASPVRERSAQ